MATTAHADNLNGAKLNGARLFVASTALADWGDDMIWWPLDETTTATRVAVGTCGSGCDLIPTGSIPNDTGTKQEGAAALDMGAVEADHLVCTDANCSALERAGSGDHSLTWGCWFRQTTGGTNYLMDKMGGGASGYQLQASGDVVGCFIDAVEEQGAIGSILNSDWVHAACVFDDSANTLKAYTDATPSAGEAVSAMTENALSFYVGASAVGPTTSLFGKVDECFVYAGAMAAASVCRICSCGITGSLCKCGSGPSATTFVSTGRNGSECGGCSLPTDCSAAAPS